MSILPSVSFENSMTGMIAERSPCQTIIAQLHPLSHQILSLSRAPYTRFVPAKITPSAALDSEEKRRPASQPVDTSDEALSVLLGRLKGALDPDEIRQLSDEIERVMFHKQFTG